MKFEELDKVDLVPYTKETYDSVRTKLNEGLELAITQQNKEVVDQFELSIHLSFCVQNLHKYFYPKLNDLLQFYNTHNERLPSELYFEPSRPKIFPPPPKTDDDLPMLNKMLIHHSNMYPMKSMAVTWGNLVEQYLSSMEYAIAENELDACVKSGSDGCFDNCISQMGVWKAEHASLQESTSKLRF